MAHKMGLDDRLHRQGNRGGHGNSAGMAGWVEARVAAEGKVTLYELSDVRHNRAEMGFSAGILPKSASQGMI